jgi:hypothetical protein
MTLRFTPAIHAEITCPIWSVGELSIFGTFEEKEAG